MTTDSRRPALPLTLMLVAALFINYVDRGMIGVAAPLIKEEMALSATAFGIAVSAFFWIYGPAQLLTGWMVDRFNAEKLLAGGVAVWGGATAAMALAPGLAPLVALRMLLGLGESAAFPASAKLIARDVPAEHRGSANAGVGAALAFGPAFGMLVGGLIMATYGWRVMFAVFGLATLLWLLPWRRFIRTAPIDTDTTANELPFSAVLRHRTLWAVCLGHFTSNYGFYFLLSWLPLYLTTVRGFTLAEMATFTALTFAAQGLVALLAGWGSDRLIERGHSASAVRRGLMLIGHVGGAVGILGIVMVDSRAATLGWLMFTGGTMGINSVGVYLIGQVFAGARAAGRWIGTQNFIGNFSGIIGPIVTGMIVDASGYSGAFYLTAGVSAVGALAWLFLVPRIQPVDWAAARLRR
ncbi:MFS transporter [Sphingoaurantiacus capsulatus]|uniref:MFS transporter n=1 Tax=Sphingoaurantiacus capsulatus TaxID=1771310 RepID=A0ABV7XE68_9SPHN